MLLDRKSLTDGKANTMPSWIKKSLSQDDDSGTGGAGELDENGHLIKSSKMFDSAPGNGSMDGDS